MIGFAAGMEMADMAWEQKCRGEDMKQRALENERHAIDDARRCVDEKAEQLKVLANQSALFAGFSMVVLVESSIPDDIDGWLLTFFGGITACVIALMLISTLNSTYMLVAILRYDCVRRDVPFDEFWRKRCEPDWKLALRAFSYGVPLFMVVVSLVAWVSFWDHQSRYISASVVTVISLMSTIFWFGRTERKWSGFLLTSEARVLTRGMSILHHSNNSHNRSKGSDNASALSDSDRSGGAGVAATATAAGVVGDVKKRYFGRKRDEEDEQSDVVSLNLSSLAIGTLSESEAKLTPR